MFCCVRVAHLSNGLWSDIKSVEKPWPLDELSHNFPMQTQTHTHTHTHINEGEGQSPRSMMEGERYRRGARHPWLTQTVFFPLWMTGHSNWLASIHSATEGWLKEQSDNFAGGGHISPYCFVALLRVRDDQCNQDTECTKDNLGIIRKYIFNHVNR